ncbi:hypothetical protein L2E82_22862 [Cichorium intybus]|uniref:Uncharacterized protein n=1 Tax=Cichorium intybus TaxID=13427 RepID=A0ACB9DZ55_CICIN|nr:hypothetical protein L2E82_22862 [Cichorium intybus]
MRCRASRPNHRFLERHSKEGKDDRGRLWWRWQQLELAKGGILERMQRESEEWLEKVGRPLLGGGRTKEKENTKVESVLCRET